MHAKTLLFTNETPTQEEIDLIMEPHCEEIDGEYNSEGFWDWYQIGGRYKGGFSVTDRSKTIIGTEAWGRDGLVYNGVDGCYIKNLSEDQWKVDTQMLINSVLKKAHTLEGYSKKIHIEYAENLKISLNDSPNWFSCYSYVDVDGNYNTRRRWDGNSFVDNPNFDEELAEVVKNKELFVTALDCHN